MNMIAIAGATASVTSLPARPALHEALPWVPLCAGKSFKPLRFLGADRGFVELLRLEPGERIARHRHTGEVHAFNVEGWRELATGEVIGPGDYVYEPAGNIDHWHVVGDAPLVVMVVVMGAVEYIDDEDEVTERYTAQRIRDLYHRHCAAIGVAPLDLDD